MDPVNTRIPHVNAKDTGVLKRSFRATRNERYHVFLKKEIVMNGAFCAKMRGPLRTYVGDGGDREGFFT